MVFTGVNNKILISLVSLYLILNYGFMLVRAPVGGSGIPIGEIVLLYSLMFIRYPVTIGRMSKVINVWPFFVWWLYIMIRVTEGAYNHGIWALRDATNILESLFILVGFAFTSRLSDFKKIIKWLPKVIIIGALYGLTYPFRDIFQEISPTITNSIGASIPILFNYINSSMLMIWAAVYLLLISDNFNKYSKKRYLSAVFLLCFAVLLFQARTLYLQVIAVFTMFFIYRRNLLGKSTASVFLGIFFVSLLPILDISIKGRLGQTVSLDFLTNHFLAIVGFEAEGVEGAAKGVGLRIGWWQDIFYRMNQSWSTFIFGLGYGFPLVDFHNVIGSVVREPHNSYISIYARSGVVGILGFIFIHFLLLRTWMRTYRICTINKFKYGQDFLLLMLTYFLLVWVYAIGEDAFEKPFIIIPYYFFWGLVLRFAYLLMSKKLDRRHLTRLDYKN